MKYLESSLCNCRTSSIGRAPAPDRAAASAPVHSLTSAGGCGFESRSDYFLRSGDLCLNIWDLCANIALAQLVERPPPKRTALRRARRSIRNQVGRLRVRIPQRLFFNNFHSSVDPTRTQIDRHAHNLKVLMFRSHAPPCPSRSPNSYVSRPGLKEDHRSRPHQRKTRSRDWGWRKRCTDVETGERGGGNPRQRRRARLPSRRCVCATVQGPAAADIRVGTQVLEPRHRHVADVSVPRFKDLQRLIFVYGGHESNRQCDQVRVRGGWCSPLRELDHIGEHESS